MAPVTTANDRSKTGMTSHQIGRTVLFMAPPSEQDAEPAPPSPRASDETMRSLRNPFEAPQADAGGQHPHH